MAIELIPRARIQPVQSQTGGVDARVVPMQDRSAGNLLAIGQGTQDLGRALTVLADRKQDNIDRGVSLDSRNVYSTDAKNEMAGPNGFMHTLGKDANDDRWKQHKERLRLSRQKIEKTLQNDAQRLNFKEHADRLELELGAQAAYHQVVESQKFAAGSTQADADQKIDRAIDFAGTEEGDVAHAEAMAGYDKWAELIGLPADDPIVLQKKQKANDRLHATVIDRLNILGKPDMASTYFNLNKGAISPGVQNKIVDEIQSAQRLAVAKKLDGDAWMYANNLSNAGLTLTEQRADLTRGVRLGIIDAETAAKAWSFARGFEDEKYQERQRERSELTQQLEQRFADDPSLEVDTLPAEVRATVDSLAMRGDAQKIHSEIRQRRIADMFAEDENASLRLSRDMRTYNDGERVAEILTDKITAMKPEELATPSGQEKKARIERRIAEIGELLDALATRPKVLTDADEVQAAPPPDPNAQPIDMQKFTEDLKRLLYPGSGR
jgi:hypothetical protein